MTAATPMARYSVLRNGSPHPQRIGTDGESLQQVQGGGDDHRARTEHRCRTHVEQQSYVTRGNHAADDDHDVGSPQFGQGCFELRNQGEVTGGE